MSFLVRLSVVLPLLLAACASGDPSALVPTLAEAPGASEQEILVATTRERAPDSPAMFSGERIESHSNKKVLDFADVDMSVPPTHKAGNIEWPDRPPGDPARDFVTRRRDYIDSEDTFLARLNAALMKRPPGQRDVLVFVHGYNVDFGEGLYRLAQVAHDTQFEGVPLLFTWASRGSAFDYVYDRDSATAARDGLTETLKLAARSKADHMVVFAHSMGNWPAMEAFRDLALEGYGADLHGRISDVVLAAPDIDVDVFKTQMRLIGPPKRPYLLLVSRDDKALRLSSFIAGSKPRAGDYVNKDVADLGVIMVDVTDVPGTDGLNHSKFATVLPQFAARLRQRLAAGDKLDFDNVSLAQRVALLGGTAGNVVGTAAGAIVTLPATIITAPVRAVAAGVERVRSGPRPPVALATPAVAAP